MATLVKRPAESWAFVLDGDRALPTEQQTRFTLRPMTINDRAAARDDLTRELVGPDGTRIIQRRTRQHSLMLALSHIVAIENFPVGAPTVVARRSSTRANATSSSSTIAMCSRSRTRSGVDPMGVDPTRQKTPRRPSAHPPRATHSAAIPPSTPASDASEQPGLKGNARSRWAAHEPVAREPRDGPASRALPASYAAAGAREEPCAVAAELDRYVDLYYPAYQEGHLLVAGGISEQPARYLELIRAIADIE
jgi:hypothetical protein